MFSGTNAKSRPAPSNRIEQNPVLASRARGKRAGALEKLQGQSALPEERHPQGMARHHAKIEPTQIDVDGKSRPRTRVSPSSPSSNDPEAGQDERDSTANGLHGRASPTACRATSQRSTFARRPTARSSVKRFATRRRERHEDLFCFRSPSSPAPYRPAGLPRPTIIRLPCAPIMCWAVWRRTIRRGPRSTIARAPST